MSCPRSSLVSTARTTISPPSVARRSAAAAGAKSIARKLSREANSSAPFEIVHEMDRAAHVLRIRVAPGVELTVDVKTATVAATRLNARLSDLLARQRASDPFERTIAIARHQASDHSEQTTL